MATTMTDATFASLTDEIEAAKRALLDVLGSEPPRPWHPYELKTRARNGCSAGSVNLGLDALIAEGTVDVTPDMQVRLAS
jgi:hypothetical protein